jgi:hypothetical protein
MESNNNNQLVKYDRTKIIEAIQASDLPELDKQELSKQVLSNEAKVIANAMQKIAESGIAQHDIANFLAELRELNKQGMYATAKLESMTGSGKIEMQFKGGDTKLIIPVLIIVAIVIIAALIVVFVH